MTIGETFSYGILGVGLLACQGAAAETVYEAQFGYGPHFVSPTSINEQIASINAASASLQGFALPSIGSSGGPHLKLGVRREPDWFAGVAYSVLSADMESKGNFGTLSIARHLSASAKLISLSVEHHFWKRDRYLAGAELRAGAGIFALHDTIERAGMESITHHSAVALTAGGSLLGGYVVSPELDFLLNVGYQLAQSGPVAWNGAEVKFDWSAPWVIVVSRVRVW